MVEHIGGPVNLEHFNKIFISDSVIVNRNLPVILVLKKIDYGDAGFSERLCEVRSPFQWAVESNLRCYN